MKIRILFVILIVLVTSACKKEAGPGGKNTIKGIVYFMNGVSGTQDVVKDAQVSIAYGTDQATLEFNKTILTNSDGSYSFEGLRKGNYYLSATYTYSHGFVYKTNGATVTLNHRKKQATAELILL